MEVDGSWYGAGAITRRLKARTHECGIGDNESLVRKAIERPEKSTTPDDFAFATASVQYHGSLNAESNTTGVATRAKQYGDDEKKTTSSKV